MDVNFHQSQKISKDRLKILMHRRDHPALIRFVIMYTLFLTMSLWVVHSWEGPWWMLVLSQLGFGIISCSIFAALHETGHGTAFKAKKLNQLTATLTGLAHVYPAHLFRELHFTHHRHTHIPGLDPEISLGNKPAPSVIKTPFLYFAWLTGIPLLSFKIFMLLVSAFGMPEAIRKRIFPFIRPKMRKKVTIESAFVLIIYLGILILALYIDDGFWGLLTGQVVAHCLLANYLVMEHNGLPHKGNILEKTRSIRANKLIKLIMWNMPYHAEHHAYPSVPFHALPLLHEEIRLELRNKDEGHSDFHLKTLTKFIKHERSNY